MNPTNPETPQPRLSIGLAVYNGARHLRESIDSLLAQDVNDFELIISDNASTDETPDICAEYAAKDPRVRFVRNDTNIGAAANFNRVFELSAGCYFMWGSDDDVWDPAFASRCIAELEAYPKTVLCSTGVTIIDEAGHPRPDIAYRNLDTAGAPVPERVQRLVLQGLWYDMYSVIRPEALRATGMYRSTYGGDVLLLLELLLLGEFISLPEQLFKYRVPSTPKTTAEHFADITGEGDGRAHSVRPWTKLATECYELLQESNLQPSARLHTQHAFIDALSSRSSAWGRAIFGEAGLSPRIPRSRGTKRRLLDGLIVAYGEDPMRMPTPSILRRLKDLTKRALVGRYCSWLIEPAMRYMPIVREINRRDCDEAIVEVGSGASGIAPYLNRPFVGVDQGFDQPVHPLLEPVAASALELPFDDLSRCCVISTDMLEHIPPNLRGQAVDELVRITRDTLILAVPAGPGAEAQDRMLAVLYHEEHGVEFPFLTEHVENGLPTIGEFKRLVDESIACSGRPASVRYKSNSNLWIRGLLMQLWIKSSRPRAYWAWIGMNHLHPVLSRMNFGECYRTLAVIDFEPVPARSE